MKKNLILLFVLVVLGAMTYFILNQEKRSTIADNPLSDFAIEDTSKVSKIFISDKVTGTAKLTRNDDGTWQINDTYRAKDEAVRLLLKAFSGITVRGKVRESKHSTIISRASGTGKKIEIYTTDSEVPEKIWISAGNTSDHHGDYFILEIPGVGISPEPFSVDMPMFGGFLTARFFTGEEDWRYSGIFNYENLDFSQIKVDKHLEPEQSFTLSYNGDNEMKVLDHQGNQVNPLDSFITKDYLLRFKKIHLESFKTYLEPHRVDSVLNRNPDWTISVTENSGEVNKLDLYHLLSDGRYHDLDGNKLQYNQDVMYGSRGDGELFKVQLAAVFRPLLIGVDYFRK